MARFYPVFINLRTVSFPLLAAMGLRSFPLSLALIDGCSCANAPWSLILSPFTTCQPANRLSIFLFGKFLGLLNKSWFLSAQIYCYKVLKRIMNLELAVSFQLSLMNIIEAWQIAGLRVIWDHLTSVRPSLLVQSNKISLILTFKKSAIVLFTLSNEAEHAFYGLLRAHNTSLSGI